ncbi:PadR family transcriptional regulator [Tenericutes bacterium MO-XQ]|jgi:PadR family transcriptional regulator PadR|nr:PadR family transcriptional regulator [Tenericutes bacterium MO-XQ]AUD63716.1 PadR family transcriptional regulator [Tenericutes bacterium MO-XQ]
MNIQFKKGVTELLVLSMLSKNDQYGYDISDRIGQSMMISPGTVYPILRKLKEDKMVTTYLSEISAGPPRKYYKLTELGLKKYNELYKDWQEFIKVTETFLEVNHG